MSRTKAPTMSAGAVLAALKAGPFREQAHAWLEKVRNRTGYGGDERYADALVVSLWPSRGIWLAGIEVKVSRNDFRAELDDPEKSAAFQKFCDYWYLATPPGIVEPGELPETWGHIIVEGKKARTEVQAPRLQPEPLSTVFVASLLRSVAKSQENVRQRAHTAGWQAAQERLGADAIATETKRANDAYAAQRTAENALAYAKADLEKLRSAVERFEQAAGLEPGTIASEAANYRSHRDLMARFELARALDGFSPEHLAGTLAKAADSLRALEELKRGAT